MGYTPPFLDVRKVAANTTAVYGGNTAGDVLILYGSVPNATPRIEVNGNNPIYTYLPNGLPLYLIDSTGSTFLTFKWTTPDAQISTATNYNLALLPDGTGKVKFGTFTGSGDVAVNGSISILDSSGNARKLATVA